MGLIVVNNCIPVKGFVAMNLFGVLFIRRDEWLKESDGARMGTINHENIHTAQMRELLYVPFYLLYLLEWLYRLLFHTKTAYRGISFEKEAYANQTDINYLATRKHYAQWKH